MFKYISILRWHEIFIPVVIKVLLLCVPYTFCNGKVELKILNFVVRKLL